MTREQILSMEAGPELNELVAVHVMGWEKCRDGDRWACNGKELGPDHATAKGDGLGDYYYPDEEWSPSSDIAAAWEVVEKIDACGDNVKRCNFRMMLDDIFTITPEAICKAALLAVMGGQP